LYTHFHEYGIQPMRKTTHLFWPEWCSSTLHDVKKIWPFPLHYKQRKEKGILVPLWGKQVSCFTHWLYTIFMEVGVQNSIQNLNLWIFGDFLSGIHINMET
jgi:hypothetical protein